MKFVGAYLFTLLIVLPGMAAAQEVTDVLATVNCPYPIPKPQTLPRGFNGERWGISFSQPGQGLGSSPLLWVPLTTTVTKASGPSGVRVVIGQVDVEGGISSSDTSGVSRLEAFFLPNHSVLVYPASTVDCLLKTLSAALTEERRANVEQRAIIEGLVTRLERSETDLRKVIADNKVEQDARFEHIESLIKAGN